MRFRVIEDCRDTWPVHELCRVLGLSTAGYYAWRSRPESKRASEERALLDDIRRAHEGSGGRYGSPRVHATLRAHGKRVGRGRVERLMRQHGVRGLITRRQRVQTTDSRHAFPVAPNLLDRQFTATTKPNQVWLADLTYIATGEGWLYVAAIMDLHTCKIVGWSMRDLSAGRVGDLGADDGRPAPAARCWPGSPFRPRYPIRLRGLPGSIEQSRHHAVHEPACQPVGQCADGKLLPHAQDRAGALQNLCHPRRSQA